MRVDANCVDLFKHELMVAIDGYCTIEKKEQKLARIKVLSDFVGTCQYGKKRKFVT